MHNFQNWGVGSGVVQILDDEDALLVAMEIEERTLGIDDSDNIYFVVGHNGELVTYKMDQGVCPSSYYTENFLRDPSIIQEWCCLVAINTTRVTSNTICVRPTTDGFDIVSTRYAFSLIWFDKWLITNTLILCAVVLVWNCRVCGCSLIRNLCLLMLIVFGWCAFEFVVHKGFISNLSKNSMIDLLASPRLGADYVGAT